MDAQNERRLNVGDVVESSRQDSLIASLLFSHRICREKHRFCRKNVSTARFRAWGKPGYRRNRWRSEVFHYPYRLLTTALWNPPAFVNVTVSPALIVRQLGVNPDSDSLVSNKIPNATSDCSRFTEVISSACCIPKSGNRSRCFSAMSFRPQDS